MLWLSVVIDNACSEVWEAWREGAPATSLRVSPDVYNAVATARPAEVARGHPLTLLGLPIIADADVTSYAPVAERAASPTQP